MSNWFWISNSFDTHPCEIRTRSYDKIDMSVVEKKAITFNSWSQLIYKDDLRNP
jgi:hypothetical protein